MELSREIEMLQSTNNIPEADQVTVVEKVIESLLKMRAEFLGRVGELNANQGFYPKYYVFNNVKGHVDDDCFVLDPKMGEADVESIEFYAEFTDDKNLSEALRNWIYAHKNLVCKFPMEEHCPIVGYNLCCGHCPNKDVCFIEGNPHLCDRVASDLFTTIEECDG